MCMSLSVKYRYINMCVCVRPYPSLSRSPVAPVESARSLPAKSTRWMSEDFVVLCLVSLKKICTVDEPVKLSQ